MGWGLGVGWGGVLVRSISCSEGGDGGQSVSEPNVTRQNPNVKYIIRQLLYVSHSVLPVFRVKRLYEVAPGEILVIKIIFDRGEIPYTPCT